MGKPLGPKTRAIREALAEHPNLTPQEIAAYVNERHKGLEVDPREVSQQRNLLKRQTGPAEQGDVGAEEAQPEPRPERPRPAAVPAGSGLGPDDLRQLAVLARRAGGWAALRRWVDALAEAGG